MHRTTFFFIFVDLKHHKKATLLQKMLTSVNFTVFLWYFFCLADWSFWLVQRPAGSDPECLRVLLHGRHAVRRIHRHEVRRETDHLPVHAHSLRAHATQSHRCHHQPLSVPCYGKCQGDFYCKIFLNASRYQKWMPFTTNKSSRTFMTY